MKNLSKPLSTSKKTLLVFLLTIACFLQSSFGSETRLSSDVKSVKVYFKGAEVVRIAKTNLAKGTTLLIFSDIADEIEPSSIQFAASKGVDVLSVSHVVNTQKAIAENTLINKMRDSISLLNDFIKAIEIQNSVMTTEENILNSNQKIASTQNGVNRAELLKILELNRKRLTEIQTEKYNNAKKLNDIRKSLADLNNRIDKELAGLPKAKGEIRVIISTANAMTANFEFKYLARVAGWIPFYDIKTDGPQSVAHLIYKAEIAQNTGEIWNNIKLTLSSANPQYGIDLPMMNNEYVGFVPKPKTVKEIYTSDRKLYMKNSMTAGAPMVMNDEGYGEGGSKPVQSSLDATFNENEVAFEFEIPLQYSIPNDGEGRIVSMKDYELNMRYEYFAIPKLDGSVFLTGIASDWKRLNILPGFANMFYGDNYTGKAFLNPSAKDDSLRFSFGRDKRILVERKLVNDFNKKSFLGSTQKQTFSYEFTVNNTQSTTITIKIIDQIPISKDEQIKVETEELSGGIPDTFSGRVEWKFILKPNESKNLRFIYSITSPKSREIYRN